MYSEKAQKLDFKDETVKPGVERGVWNGGPFTVVRYKYAPGAKFPSHSHEASQLTIILEGSIEFSVGEDKIFVTAGETIYIPSGESHSAEVPKDGESVHSINVFYPPREKHP
ncbi:MAG: cupin domain-containing protein [Deltaproteobacteria bacterium]|uniref:Cupin domain-containing protein n=1 Tax=Candidatus Zymogenus saltonus TaxID=2844893 RepID=A0A9D8KFZ3_9DELT|nr:cupin domain-containing protein [Candidatus Zymogenus saltonus]